jgi:hypothetical protein
MGLVGVFSYNSVFAQEGETIPASEVDQTSKESVRAFVERAKDRILEIGTGEFRKESRIEGGPWRYQSTYLILMEGKYPLIHGYYRDAEDRDIGSQTAELLAELEGKDGPECVEYNDHEGGQAGRYACAVRLNATFRAGGPGLSAVLIGGLHHEPLPEEPFEDLLGSSYVPDTKASDVVDAETLKLFVEDALEALVKNFGVDRMDAPITTRFRPVLRREGGYWNQNDTYLFVMRGDGVVFNGNDQALEDTTLNITDLNGCNVGDEILRVIGSDNDSEVRECPSLGLLPEGDSENFIEYLWDNPDKEGDEDKRFDDPAFGQRISPGITPKLGYVKSFRLPGGVDLIVGAGVYPTDTGMGGGGGDGCAIAGSGNTGKSTLLNLFLAGCVFGYCVLRFRGKTFSGAKDNRRLSLMIRARDDLG